ncbi:FG-GAP-like repeat-containing protein [Microvirga tunisiensis]|uniref:Calcium-binding protein n=1 Tax=Microvirga tunisiensis TaxID=2108360 RepID=A0A5N7MRF3_9HYPH|nr:FG-GAP-like repeat-containing protein [Microvirga tunisiensis]MPR11571.1 hypothetical protein [Microvirga tunisiensis]MPR29585.1 hypothetical protein [Microvirga tunisiensis]
MIATDGSDTLEGTLGSDTLRGGRGDDTYYVNHFDDRVLEEPGEGNDIVLSSINFALAQGSEVEVLRAIVAAGLALTGNEFSNTIIGSVGNDTLDGGGGVDSLAGGGGNDTYLVDDPLDLTTEAAGAGYDTVLTNVSYSLTDTSEIEELKARGTAPINLAGNSLDNSLFGNVAANEIHGRAGNDAIYGDGGDDRLSGDDGQDTLYGGMGDDRLDGGNGDDWLYGDVGNDTFIGGDGNDVLYGGVGDDYLDAGSGDDIIYGDVGNDTVHGGSGNDLIYGGPGNGLHYGGGDNDAIYGSFNNDVIFGEAGDDRLSGDSGSDFIDGGDGDDVLVGGGGSDILDGGAGFDAAVFLGHFDRYDLMWRDSQSIIVIDQLGTDGTEFISNIEQFMFADVTYSFSDANFLAKLAKGGSYFNYSAIALAGFGSSSTAGGWTSNDRYPRQLADVNGDGRTDIVGFGEAGALVSLATPGGTFAGMSLALAGFGSSASAGGWASNDRYPRQLADVNGDGRTDILGFGEDGVLVSLAQADGTFGGMRLASAGFGASAASGGWASNDRYPRQLADVNGDGRADIVGFGEDGVYVALATGGGSFAGPTLTLAAFGASAAAGGWSSNGRYLRKLGDVNGDGRADIVAFSEAGVYVALASSNGSFLTPSFALPAFSAGAGGWASNSLYPRDLADVNGDGQADIVGFGSAGTYISFAKDTLLL